MLQDVRSTTEGSSSKSGFRLPASGDVFLPEKSFFMTTATATNVGKIVQVIGPVLDVEFQPEHLPEIYNAL